MFAPYLFFLRYVSPRCSLINLRCIKKDYFTHRRFIGLRSSRKEYILNTINLLLEFLESFLHAVMACFCGVGAIYIVLVIHRQNDVHIYCLWDVIIWQ
jgi:hypothetical protein